MKLPPEPRLAEMFLVSRATQTNKNLNYPKRGFVKIKSHSAVPALVLSVCGLLAPALRAQEFRARIQGMVTDPSQAVVVGVS